MTAYETRLNQLVDRLGDIAQRNGVLAQYSAAGVGGPADVLVVARTPADVQRAIVESRALALPYKVFGGLSNCLVSDRGLQGVIVLNQARDFRFADDYQIHADSGALVIKVARAAVARGWGGLTWAVGLPGTVGGAVINNAGAFGGETSKALRSAVLLGPGGNVHEVTPDWFNFRYRCSRLKGAGEDWVVLTATFQLRPRDREHLQAKAAEYTQRRQRTQPPGRTLGSTFKNPEGDYAGRLIEAAGLKGTRVGSIVVSHHHANFFVNEGGGTAADYLTLIRQVQDEVERKFGIRLEPEIELIG
jgi:UDP-N-acetylmuramate dehydrogenase